MLIVNAVIKMEGHLKLRQQYLEKPGRLFDP